MPERAMTARRLILALLVVLILGCSVTAVQAAPEHLDQRAQVAVDRARGWLDHTYGWKAPQRTVVVVPNGSLAAGTDGLAPGWAVAARVEGPVMKVERMIALGWREVARGAMRIRVLDLDDIRVLLHENLHDLGPYDAYEEAAVDAVAADAVAPFVYQVLAFPGAVERDQAVGYPETVRDPAGQIERLGVRDERAMSARATCGSWRTYAARQWRWAFLRAQTPQRQAMIAGSAGAGCAPPLPGTDG